MGGSTGHSAGDDGPTLAVVRAALDEWAPELPRRLTVAFSGGLDSTVLLAALARLEPTARLRAAHVDHGLHPAAAGWSEQCGRIAAQLGIEFIATRVVVDAAGGKGLEAAARDARYAALAKVLEAGEWLLTAHHADDQLETVLLRLLRGAGVRGLRGIIPFGPFANAYLGRPLLKLTRAELRAQAAAWGLEWIEDPANRELRHDRNFLRLRVLPELVGRWPAAVRHVERMAAQMAEAEEILETVARDDAARLAVPWCVAGQMLAALTPARQRNLLRYLVRQQGLSTPSAAKLDELRASVLTVRADSQAAVRWPGGEARVFRGALHLMGPLPEPSAVDGAWPLAAGGVWQGPEGVVELVASEDGRGLPQQWVEQGLLLRFRGGGERFRPLGSRHHRTLKYLFQEHAVVPWMRRRIPLLFRGGDLVAVGDSWVTADVESVAPGERRWRVRWSEHPPVHAPGA